MCDFSLQEFTQSCLGHDAKLRPTAHDLLFHRVLFEVHSLKLLAAHCLINNQCEFLTSSCRASSHIFNVSHLTFALMLVQILTLRLQTCFQRTVWRRKPSPSTPVPSWQRSDMTTDKEFSSSKTSSPPLITICQTHSRHRASHRICFFSSISTGRYSHVSPLELDKFLEDVKYVKVQSTVCICGILMWK